MCWNPWKSLCTVISKIPINLPGFPEVIRPLDEHSGWAEGLKPKDQMSEVELSLQVKLYVDILFTILSLPPPKFPVTSEGRDDVLHSVAHFVLLVWSPRVADKAFVGLVFQMTDNAVAFCRITTTRRTCLQSVRPPNQKVASGRVAAALVTGRLTSGGALR